MKKHNLVLVPGLMCDHSAWDPMLEGLRPVACCQIIDHGQARSLVVMAQQLLALAPPRFALAGHSMGGRVALESDELTLDSGTLIEAKGFTGGGTVWVGGGWQGSGHLHQATARIILAQRDRVAATKLSLDG